MKKIFGFLIASILVVSCTPPEVGYISDTIHLQSPTIVVPRGVYTLGVLPIVDGSTYPLEWEIASVTDKDGNVTNELQEPRDLLVWKKAFDPNTDTTMELAMQKLELRKVPAILLNENSGQFSFTQTTAKVLGDDFDVSVMAKNVKGERLVKNYAHIKLTPFKPVEIINTMAAELHFKNNTGVWDVAYAYSLADVNDSKIPSILNGTNPYMTIVKVSDEPKLSVKVKQIITDSNNQVLDPAKVVFNPDRLQNFHDNTIGVETDAVGSTFGLPAPPFPQYGRRNASGTGMYWMYYLTTTDSFTVDKVAFEAANPVPAGGWAAYWAKYSNENLLNRGYIRWAFKINDTGTWEVKMKIPFTKVK